MCTPFYKARYTIMGHFEMERRNSENGIKSPYMTVSHK